MDKVTSIHVSIHDGKDMPADLRHRVQVRSQARAFCRGFLHHCDDILSETIGLTERVEEFHDAVDMGRDVTNRLYKLDGSLPQDLQVWAVAAADDSWDREA